MSKNVKYTRLILKSSSIPGLSATTAPNDDHTITPSWSDSDIYKSEILVNIQDDKIYIRTNNGINEIPVSRFNNLNYGDVISYDGTRWINASYCLTGGTGTSGSSGSSGTNGTSGSSGSSGTNGTSGSSGSSGLSIQSLTGLTDVVISSISQYDVLKYSGGTWNNDRENSIIDIVWDKDTQTLSLEDLYNVMPIKIEGRPIDRLTGNTDINDDFYTLLCNSGLTINLPPTSGFSYNDSYHGSIFKFKLIQSGTTTINCVGVDQIFDADPVNGIVLSASYSLSELGKTITIQSYSDESLWYMI